VIFDIGHGAGSFGCHACRGLLAAGFLPDAISSDVHVLNIDGPAYDLLETMSKFLVLGMDLGAIVASVTSAPAAAIRRPSLGSLAVGTEGDATILDIEHGAFEFRDTQGESLGADRRFRLKGMVVGGKPWPDK
jgi:dihydroorotase